MQTRQIAVDTTVAQMSEDEMYWIRSKDNLVNEAPFSFKPILSMQVHFDSFSDDNMLRVLKLFGNHKHCTQCNEILLSGYIRSMQSNLSQIIPSDINSICHSFYFEEEDSFIHLSYQIYKAMTPSSNKISGADLVSMIEKKNLIGDANSKTAEICAQLLQFGLFELVSFETEFSFFVKMQSEGIPVFKASQKYFYQIGRDKVSVFDEHLGISTPKKRKICAKSSMLNLSLPSTEFSNPLRLELSTSSHASTPDALWFDFDFDSIEYIDSDSESKVVLELSK